MNTDNPIKNNLYGEVLKKKLVYLNIPFFFNSEHENIIEDDDDSDETEII
jgi:hypothetical protein